MWTGTRGCKSNVLVSAACECKKFKEIQLQQERVWVSIPCNLHSYDDNLPFITSKNFTTKSQKNWLIPQESPITWMSLFQLWMKHFHRAIFYISSKYAAGWSLLLMVLNNDINNIWQSLLYCSFRRTVQHSGLLDNDSVSLVTTLYTHQHLMSLIVVNHPLISCSQFLSDASHC